jgi:hypothetical protein
MKHGVLFFFNMGNITTGARIAILPLIYLTFWQVRPLGVAFFTCLTLLVISFFTAMIPAPPDRAAKNTIRDFHEEHQQTLMDESKVINPKSLTMLYGYGEVPKMWMRRRVGKEMIYPLPVAMGYTARADKSFLLLGEKTLLDPSPAVYRLIELTGEKRLQTQVDMDPENETVVRITLRHPSLQEDFIAYFANDYHYREFLTLIQ